MSFHIVHKSMFSFCKLGEGHVRVRSFGYSRDAKASSFDRLSFAARTSHFSAHSTPPALAMAAAVCIPLLVVFVSGIDGSATSNALSGVRGAPVMTLLVTGYGITC